MAKKDDTKEIAKELKLLAFEKRIVVSDGYMYETEWDVRDDVFNPIRIVEKTVRGTQSQRKANEKAESSNIQTVDSAALKLDKDTLKIKFSLKFLSQVFKPTACNVFDRYEKILEMGKEYREEYGYDELSKRYAINIANGRFLWRNRFGAEEISITVKTKVDGTDKSWSFDAYNFRLNSFETDNSDVLEIADIIKRVFNDEQTFALFQIEANAKLGVGQEVYPSEELIPNKEKDKNKEGKKSKVLYQVDGIAAMHSQKLNNAIRTIDTWYDEFEKRDIGPIAIEPFGSVTNLGEAFRKEKNHSFYEIFDKYSKLGKLPENAEEAHYLAAILIRGGVFGESNKE